MVVVDFEDVSREFTKCSHQVGLHLGFVESGGPKSGTVEGAPEPVERAERFLGDAGESRLKEPGCK